MTSGSPSGPWSSGVPMSRLEADTRRGFGAAAAFGSGAPLGTGTGLGARVQLRWRDFDRGTGSSCAELGSFVQLGFGAGVELALEVGIDLGGRAERGHGSDERLAIRNQREAHRLQRELRVGGQATHVAKAGR